MPGCASVDDDDDVINKHELRTRPKLESNGIREGVGQRGRYYSYKVYMYTLARC